ncbi:DUF2207 domain-containing protein [Mariniluteicoccus endophyticus]
MLARAARLLAALVLVVAGGLALPQPAFAATGDRISAFAAAYTVNTDGSMDVTETITYEFASSSHGLERFLVTRERWDDEQDAVYAIRDIAVSSPTGAPTMYSTSQARNGSDATLRIRVGDPNRYVDRTETYVLRYTVDGATRQSSDYDELYWDVTGFEWRASMSNVSATVTVPQGPKELVCFAGPVQSKTPCTSKRSDGGRATFTQAALPQNQNLSVGVKIAKGAVTGAGPRLEPNTTVENRRTAIGVGAATGVTALVAPLLGFLYWRRNGRDERYVGVAPGMVPAGGQPVRVERSGKVTIPVAFSPPDIPVGEAGLLIDGAVDVRDTTATIVELARRGAVQLSKVGDRQFSMTLLDPQRVSAPHETVLLNTLFGGGAGAVTLGQNGEMMAAHQAVTTSLRSQVTMRRWFKRLPGAGHHLGIGSLWSVVAFGGFALYAFGPDVLLDLMGPAASLLWLVPLVPVLVTWWVTRAKMRRGQRTAAGRAVADQIEGFRTYMATAEADQLRFEEGEDIFSKYLPWAVMFDLTDRWTKVCERLVEMGRLETIQPGWFYFSPYDFVYLDSAVRTSTLPEPPPPTTGSMGSGFGGGSSFGGGGFSGGGGGGGGGGSW